MGDLSKAKPADLILITDIHGDHLSAPSVDKLKKAGTVVVGPKSVADMLPGTMVIANGETKTFAGVMVEAVLSDREPASGARVLPFVNGMGGTPQMELYVLYHEIETLLREAGLVPARNLVGSYITSLEMAGASLTLLELDPELTALWDAPVHTPALRWGA